MSTDFREGLKQRETIEHPNLLQVLSDFGLYDADGFPLQPYDPTEYLNEGGLTEAPYERGDSPSRDQAGLPYNSAWFEHVRANYAESLRLLEGLRQGYISEINGGNPLSSEDIQSVYRMGIKLPSFLVWREDNPVRNGEIPPPFTVLRQALLGIGTVILNNPGAELTDLSGARVAEIAEERGDLVGADDSFFTQMPRMVCPASPDMIAGLANALLKGNEKRGVSALVEEYGVDIVRLRDFAELVKEHHQAERQLVLGPAAKLYKEPPRPSRPIRLTTKLEKYDAMIEKYVAALNGMQPLLYHILGRTDTPPVVTLRDIYRARHEFLSGRVKAVTTDHPSNLTPEVVASFEAIRPELKYIDVDEQS